MSGKHRLFFALEPRAQIRQEMHAIQQRLNVTGRAIPVTQFHVTLAFLGMQESVLIPKLCEMAAQISFVPCSLVLDRLDTFRRSDVLWLGAEVIPAVLNDFRCALITGLADAGIRFDRKAWKPHVSLYRRLRKPLPIMDTVPVIWPLDGFSLIESVSVKNGVEYRRQAHWNSQSSVNYS